MTPERWLQVKNLFNRALALDSSVRNDFLDQACADDATLRSEIVSLIAAHEDAGDFLNAPANISLAENYEDLDDRSVSLIGLNINHYRILSLIARGGMGEVYLAEDENLGRRVVMKVLPARYTEDIDRVRRFEQEARAASALNHPNIVTIYEVGAVADTRYIVTEYVDGETLRERLKREPLRLGEILEVAMQTAAALAVAHEHGIIHRDIKPENIMLRRDGFIKLLDFGIAKLNRFALSTGSPDLRASTVDLVQTAPHQVVGTVSYMSPEQARGRTVDARTDVWSLGVVLYEMLAGKLPFEGDTPFEIIAAVIEKNPVPVSQLAPAAPVELTKFVRRALAKDPDERYQTIRDFYLDLRNHKLELEAAETSDEYDYTRFDNDADAAHHRTSGRFASASLRDVVSGNLPSSYERIARQRTGRNITGNPLLKNTAPPDNRLGENQSSSVSHPRVASAASLSTKSIWLMIGLICLIGIVAYQATQTWRNSKTAFPSNASTDSEFGSVVNLTNSGRVEQAAISPDGKFIAYAERNGSLQALLLRNTMTAETIEKIPPQPVSYKGISFAPDGNTIYLTRVEDKIEGVLRSVSVLGNTERKIMDGVDSPVSFAPDGNRFAFVRFEPSRGAYYLMTATKDGANSRVLTSREGGETIGRRGPAWSPQDNVIVCAAGSYEGGYHDYLFAIAADGGSEQRLAASQKWFNIHQIVWRDAKRLVFSASNKAVSGGQLWQMDYPDGAIVPLTRDSGNYTQIGIARQTDSLIALQYTRNYAIWIAPRGDWSKLKQTYSGVGASFGLALSRDNQLVFSSVAGEHLNLAKWTADSANRQQLTINTGDNYHPTISPDNRFIVFASNRSGTFNLWRINAVDGSNPVQLTVGGSDFYPTFTPDGKDIIYEHQKQGAPTLWRVSVDGGDARQLYEPYASLPAVSPDNRFVAARYFIAEGQRGIAILPLEGGAPVKTFPIPIVEYQRVRWTRDGRNLIYVNARDGIYSLWMQPLDGSSPRPLSNVLESTIYSFDYNPTDETVAIERGTRISDALLLRSTAAQK